MSVNVGTIAGGSRPNVIADEASAIIDVRAATDDQMKTVDAMRSPARAPRPARRAWTSAADSTVRRSNARPGSRVCTIEARAVARELGWDLAEGGTGGGSDGNFTAAVGVPTLDGLGAVGDGAHALHEHVEVDALADRAALLAGLMARIE